MTAPGPSSERAAGHGEVFTRRWVAELILDLVGYQPEHDLAARRLIEPSCGTGAFLQVIASRMSDSCRRHGWGLHAASQSVAAFDLLGRNTEVATQRVIEVFTAAGWARSEARDVATSWIRTEDYLLAGFEPGFARGTVDYVVGNPPYLRIEDVPEIRSRDYRQAWPTMSGRADVFVGFFERGLHSLRSGGRLGFICADRWMRNQYGGGLRDLVARDFSMDVVISMHDVDAFESEVSAYPAITVLSARPQGAAVVIQAGTAFGAADAAAVVEFAASTPAFSASSPAFAASSPAIATSPGSPISGVRDPIANSSFSAVRLPGWFGGDSSWPQASGPRLEMIRRLTADFPPLQDARTGTRVGIGVATGADRVFVVPQPIDVEPDRLLPLTMVADVVTGTVHWSGHHLINPWTPAGLADLADYPKLRRYFEAHAEVLRHRSLAGRYPARWYATIDRVTDGLIERPKLLLPDLRRSIHPVLDPGGTYPHHNLYYVVSEDWNLRVLGGLLLSRVANAFVEAYAVRMRGGTLRFQAQYLRRIRVPERESISPDDAAALAEAFDRRDVDAATTVALRCYGLTELPI